MAGVVRPLPVGQRQRNPEARGGSPNEKSRGRIPTIFIASLEPKSPADDRRVGAKELAPEPVGEDDPGVVADRAFGLRESYALVPD